MILILYRNIMLRKSKTLVGCWVKKDWLLYCKEIQSTFRNIVKDQVTEKHGNDHDLGSCSFASLMLCWNHGDSNPSPMAGFDQILALVILLSSPGQSQSASCFLCPQELVQELFIQGPLMILLEILSQILFFLDCNVLIYICSSYFVILEMPA